MTPDPSLSRTVELRLRAAVESSPSGLLMIDGEGRIVLLNREVERLFGYSREELLGKPVELLVPERMRGRHPMFRASFTADPKVRAMGVGRELFGRRKDGTEVPVEIGLTPVATEEGLFVLSSVVDITARKEAEDERRRLEEQLRQSQKMEAVGTLAGGIAHDFNNILGSILGYAEMIRSAADQHPRIAADAEEILRASARGKDLVERILRFSRRQEAVRRPMDLTQPVNEVAKLLRATLPATITTEVTTDPLATRVVADATSVHQVLMNLATNAAHAMPEGGRIVFRVLREYVRDSMARTHPDLHEGPYVVLRVSDTGPGIDPAIQDRIFEPFFTTKGPGEGSGLGLAMVHGIMQEHQGAVLVDSEPGRGTAIGCYFPAIEAEPLTPPTERGRVREGAGQRVLYVDDEGSLAALGERRLESLGYQPVVETNPVRALERLRADPQAYDLVITDFSMPGLTGLGLAEAIVALRPDLPILLQTGFLDQLPEEHLTRVGIRRVLKKPATIDELAEAVDDLLHR